MQKPKLKVSLISTNVNRPKSLIKRKRFWGDFPGGSVAKISHSQCRGPRFDPWSGNWIPHFTTKTSHAETKKLHHAGMIPRDATKTRLNQVNK